MMITDELAHFLRIREWLIGIQDALLQVYLPTSNAVQNCRSALNYTEKVIKKLKSAQIKEWGGES